MDKTVVVDCMRHVVLCVWSHLPPSLPSFPSLPFPRTVCCLLSAVCCVLLCALLPSLLSSGVPLLIFESNQRSLFTFSHIYLILPLSVKRLRVFSWSLNSLTRQNGREREELN